MAGIHVLKTKQKLVFGRETEINCAIGRMFILREPSHIELPPSSSSKHQVFGGKTSEYNILSTLRKEER